jgi:hypothetical protein
MVHNISESKMSSAESKFNEFIQKGDDFYKIELLRQAKSWYNKALALNIENDRVKSRISDCERLLAFESKVVYILISIASALVLVYLFFIK